MTPSLRTRLLAGTIGGMVLLLACFSVIVYAVIRRALLNEFDRSLESIARVLATGVEFEGEGIELDFGAEQTGEFNDPQRPAFYQIWDLHGKVVARSPLPGEHDLPRFHGSLDVPAHRDFREPRTSRPLRAVGVEFSPRFEAEESQGPAPVLPGRTLVMVVARDASLLNRHLSFLRWLLLGAAAGTASLTLLVGAVVVRRGLHPLQSIAAEIAAIRETALDARVGTGPTPAEIVPIRDRLNNLLARLKEAFERERRFSANVAHELRNPLAGMRSTIEVTLARQRDSMEYRHALAECLGIVDGMQAMVNNLLLLARADADQIVFHAEDIALCEAVETAWQPFSSRARERAVTFENRVPPDLTLTCDRQSLLVIFSNLLSNVAEYTNPGGKAWIEAHGTGDRVEITAANTGCRLDTEQVTRVFDRFWRADPARSDAGTHCGLGLSLAHRIVSALGGSISATVENGTFVLRLTVPSKSRAFPEPPAGSHP